MASYGWRIGFCCVCVREVGICIYTSMHISLRTNSHQPRADLDGKEGGGRQEEGRLPDGLGGVHRDRIGGVLEQRDAEVGGHVVEGRDLVGPRPAGEEVAGLLVGWACQSSRAGR